MSSPAKEPNSSASEAGWLQAKIDAGNNKNPNKYRVKLFAIQFNQNIETELYKLEK